jgi:hypothetical protein
MGVWRRKEQKEQHRWNTGKWKDGKVIKQSWRRIWIKQGVEQRWIKERMV